MRDYYPFIWGELKWSHLSSGVTAASRDVLSRAAGLPSEHLLCVCLQSAAHCCFPFFPCFPLCKIIFYRDELWAHSEYFRCQTSCFSLSNVTSSMTRCISEWHHGIKLRMVEEKWLWEPRDLCLSLYLSASCLKMLNKKPANECSLCREEGS